jgi:hypothetical protein
VRTNNDGLETLAGSHQKSGPAILEPIGSILILEADEVEMRPWWTARAITDGGQILLIQVLFARKRTIRVFNHVSVCVRRTFQQPAKDACSVFNPAGGGKPEFQFSSVRQCAFPVIARLAIADESAFVLQKKNPSACGTSSSLVSLMKTSERGNPTSSS